MKKLLIILGFSFSMIHAVSFHASKETLRRIFSHIVQQQRGAYFSFSEQDLADIGNNSELQNVLRLNGSSIYKSVYYPCKGPLLDKDVPLEDMKSRCNVIAQKFTPFMGGSMDSMTPDLYEFQPLHVLAQYEHDMHYCVRFMWALKNHISVCITQDEIAEELKKLLFGERCIYIAKSSFANVDELETYCLQNLPAKFSVVAYDGGVDGIVLANRLYSRGANIFSFSLGDFISVLEGKKTEYGIDVDKLRSMLSRDIKILYTAALLHNNQFEFRKNEYMTTMNGLNSYWHMPYVVEAMRDSADYLVHGAAGVFNSGVNNSNLRNKGVNEGRSMIKAFEHYKFDDEAIIVKLTGRYHFKSDSFLRLIENTPEIDGYVTLDPRSLLSFTGCFGLKCKYFKEMLYEIDWNYMESNMIDIERKVLEFMRKIERERGAKILYLDEVDVKSFVNHTFHYEW